MTNKTPLSVSWFDRRRKLNASKNKLPIWVLKKKKKKKEARNLISKEEFVLFERIAWFNDERKARIFGVRLVYGMWVLHGKSCCGKEQLKVTSPDWLKGVYECALKDFRVFGNGGRGSMVGTVVYVGANLKACRNVQ